MALVDDTLAAVLWDLGGWTAMVVLCGEKTAWALRLQLYESLSVAVGRGRTQKQEHVPAHEIPLPSERSKNIPNKERGIRGGEAWKEPLPAGAQQRTLASSSRVFLEFMFSQFLAGGGGGVARNVQQYGSGPFKKPKGHSFESGVASAHARGTLLKFFHPESPIKPP